MKEKVGFIGLGLIGGSIAKAIRQYYPEYEIVAFDKNKEALALATQESVIDVAATTIDGNFHQCSYIFLCAPVSCNDENLLTLKQHLAPHTILTDVGSVKTGIHRQVDALGLKDLFIGGHPMAGSEQSGIAGARADLFEGANWILCPDERTAPEDFQHLHEFVCGLEARVVSLRREEHDAAVAIVSHVPHMVASSLMQLASAHADDTGSIMRLAAGGFKDTTRIAAGSPKLWCGIAFENAEALRDGLAEMAAIIGSFPDAPAAGDRDTFTRLLAEAADARRALPAAWVPSTEKLLEVRIPMVNRTGVVAEVCTIASSVGCNIQSIDIDHISEGNAVLSLILTDDGDVGALSLQLINAGFSVSFSPLMPKEYAHVD